MDIMNIIKAISEFGILVICAAIVIWQSIEDRKRQTENEARQEQKNSDLINALKEQNVLMLGQIIQKVDMGHIITTEEDKDISKIEKELEKSLNEMLKETNANRVAIFRYHNGGKDYSGRSFLRMSMTNEVVKCGTALIQHQSQNLFRSMFFKLINSLETNGYDYIHDCEDIKEEDPGFYRYLKDFDVSSKYSIALYGSHDKVIGYLTIYFSNKEDVDFKKIEDCLKDKKIKIETLLSL